MNPEIPKDFPRDKGIALDLRLRLQNGHQIDLEMQSTVPDGVHVLELPHLALASADRRAKLERWARFLAAQTPDELEALAKEDPMMNTALNALERLSSDPEAQRLAEERETALLVHQHYMASAFEAGEAKTELKERRETVRLLCRVFGITLDEARSERLSLLDAAGLSNLIGRLETERTWPEKL